MDQSQMASFLVSLVWTILAILAVCSLLLYLAQIIRIIKTKNKPECYGDYPTDRLIEEERHCPDCYHQSDCYLRTGFNYDRRKKEG